MSRSAAAAVVLGAILASTSGCNHLQCGEGTFANGDECLAYDPNDKTPPVTTITPAASRTRAPLPDSVTLTTDEPARIYYTTDGTDPDPSVPGQRDQQTIVNITQDMTIKFFAIDLAGNREAQQSATFESDVTAPAPVSNLAVAVTANTAHVSWTNPTDPDFAGTVIARVTDVIDTTPAPGAFYAAGPMTPSVTILAVGTTTSLDDPNRPPGPVRYVAWTYDDLGNYSAAVAASGQVALGSLTAQLTYNTATQTLAIVQSPANLSLTGTTAALVGTQLTLALVVANNTAEYFQNPKAEVVSLTNATFGNSDGTADAHAFRSLGPNALAPAATATAVLVFTVPANTTATINLAIAEHPTMLSTANQLFQVGMVDFGTGGSLAPMPLTTTGPNDRAGGRIRQALFTGAHYLDIPTTHGAIERFDLVTHTRVGVAALDVGDRCNIQSLISTGAEMIAVVKFAGRRRSGTMGVYRIDEGLHVIGKLLLPLGDDKGFGRATLAPDGATLAVPLSNAILMVDTRTLTFVDSDPTTPELDTIDPGVSGQVRTVVFFGSGSMLVLSRSGGQAAILDRVGGRLVRTLYQDGDPTAKGFSATTGPDGRIWMAFSSGIRAFDPATETVSNVGYGGAPGGLSVINNQMWIIRNDRVNLDQVSNTGAVQRTVTVPLGVYGHWLTLAR